MTRYGSVIPPAIDLREHVQSVLYAGNELTSGLIRRAVEACFCEPPLTLHDVQMALYRLVQAGDVERVVAGDVCRYRLRRSAA